MDSAILPPRAVIGMLHVPALPGAPRNELSWPAIQDFVARDAAALAEGGVTALMIENFGDTPFFPRRVPSETIAYLTVLARQIASAHPDLPLGINVLRNDGLAALAIADATGARFIRVNVYTGARVADQGLLEGEAHRIQALRKQSDSKVAVFADVQVKHSSPLGAERPLEDEIEDTVRRGGAAGVILSGAATGRPTALNEVKRARKAAAGGLVLVGSGVDARNVRSYLASADAVIVGSSLKQNGRVESPVELARVRQLVAAAIR